MVNVKFDDMDRAILKILLQNSRQTTKEISKKVHLPITTVHNRIKKMRDHDIIINYTVNLNYKKLGRPIMAYIGITIDYTAATTDGKRVNQLAIAQAIKKIPDVEDATILAGGTDIIARVIVPDIDALNDLVTEDLRNIPGIDKTQTMIVLRQV